jgi:hypothetical protein
MNGLGSVDSRPPEHHRAVGSRPWVSVLTAFSKESGVLCLRISAGATTAGAQGRRSISGQRFAEGTAVQVVIRARADSLAAVTVSGRPARCRPITGMFW